MKTYARIQDGIVAEIFQTDGDIATLFHPDLVWKNITSASPPPQEGWSYDGRRYTEPVAPPAPTIYIPNWLVRQRLQAAGKWDAAVSAMSAAQQIEFATLQEGIDPNDATVVALLTGIGITDPAAILAPA